MENSLKIRFKAKIICIHTYIYICIYMYMHCHVWLADGTCHEKWEWFINNGPAWKWVQDPIDKGSGENSPATSGLRRQMLRWLRYLWNLIWDIWAFIVRITLGWICSAFWITKLLDISPKFPQNGGYISPQYPVDDQSYPNRPQSSPIWALQAVMCTTSSNAHSDVHPSKFLSGA